MFIRLEVMSNRFGIFLALGQESMEIYLLRPLFSLLALVLGLSDRICA